MTVKDEDCMCRREFEKAKHICIFIIRVTSENSGAFHHDSEVCRETVKWQELFLEELLQL